MSVTITSPVARPTITKWAVGSILCYDTERKFCIAQIQFLSASDELVDSRSVSVSNGNCEGWEIVASGIPSPIQQSLPTGFDDLATAMAATGGPTANLESYLDSTTLMP